jgi:hypothetical protein
MLLAPAGEIEAILNAAREMTAGRVETTESNEASVAG